MPRGPFTFTVGEMALDGRTLCPAAGIAAQSQYGILKLTAAATY